MIQAILLAAGSSSRFGSPKQLVRINGELILTHIIRSTLQAGIKDIIVVLGANFDLIQKHIKHEEVEIINNKRWADGLSTSIKIGVRKAIKNQSNAAIIIPCDMPFINEEILSEIIRIHESNPDTIISCNYGKSLGPPTLFPKSYFETLQDLEGDSGGKRILKNEDNIALVDFELGKYDVDTKEDLIRIKSLKGN